MIENTTERIRQLLRSGHEDAATALTRELLESVIGRPVSDVRINRDAYSLNSVNGFVRDASDELFFKFHQEENEQAGVAEYYNAQVLRAAGYPVSVPLYCSTAPGRQLLVYRRETAPRLADICAAIESGADRVDADRDRGSGTDIGSAPAIAPALAMRTNDVVAAQAQADRRFAEIAVTTLRYQARPPPSPASLFQLFHHRLMDAPASRENAEPVTPVESTRLAERVDLSGSGELRASADPVEPVASIAYGIERSGAAPVRPTLGGRAARFYFGRRVEWPGLSAPFDELAELPWSINGVDYPITLRVAFERARIVLDPAAHVPGPVITAHGDAHNANVWYRPGRSGEPGELTLFDPAFAGSDVPALLAEVKASFHNIFAHPFWLYAPVHFATRFSARAARVDGRIRVETDYALSPLRQAFLESKASRFWRPLLTELAVRGWLADDWETTVRLALFACPTLVMPLLPGPDSTHNPTSSLVGFSQAVRCACAPADEDARDDVTRFLALCRPGA